jgi:GTPase
MLIDNVRITIKAGNGGGGAHTFSKTKNGKGGPDGGNGGNGGSIYFQGSSNEYDLHEFRYKKKVEAQDGVAGKRKNLFGRNAPNITIFVPLGTQITDEKRGIVYEIVDDKTQMLLACGGMGGKGNYEFRTATNQAPKYSEPGRKGEEKELLLNLRLIAEIGLIGLPNAGKSSLLSVLTNATPAIANYPFTTLSPNIGMLGTHPIADIPGLIEGASTGKGLGITFLKHIEKTKILVHCIDVTVDDPEKTYQTVRKEFAEYSLTLLDKPEIVVLNKTDLSDSKTIKKYKTLFEKKGLPVLTCSIYDEKSIEALKSTLLAKISE